MAHLSWGKGPLNAVVVKFDAVSIVEHEQGSTVTSHPVEVGSDITDHVRPNRPRVTITGYVSNTPLFSTSVTVSRGAVSLPAGVYRPVALGKSPVPPRVPVFLGLGDAISNAIRPRSGPTHVDCLVFESESSRIREMMEALTEAQAKKELVSVSDEVSDYENMIIESVTASRTAEGGNGAVFTLSLQQISFVSTSIVDAPISAELRGQASASVGTSSPKRSASAPKDSPLEKAKKTEAKSLLASVFDAARAGL